MAREPRRTAGVQGVLRSPGKPLDAPVRTRFESRFQHDFSRVRVHDDANAAHSAADLDARAWTFGNDIAFDRGMYAPATPLGAALLDHELHHVVQQHGLPTPATPEVAADDAAQPQTAQIQRSAWSTFLDVVLFVPRLFGLSYFPDEDLKNYLDGLKTRKGEPQGSLFADNMARACVAEENRLGPYNTDQKVGLVRDMLQGWTTGADEEAIIALLRRSADRDQIVTRVGRNTLWSNFDGRNRRIIEAVTMTSADAGTLVDRLRDLDPDEVQDYVSNATDPQVAAAAQRALALSRITAPVPATAVLRPSGEATFLINGVQIFARPDEFNPALGHAAFTHTEFVVVPPAEIRITPANEKVPVGPGVIPVILPTLTIWTEYSSEAQKKLRPSYGLGTRSGDVPTVRGHERGHGQAWFDFLRQNPVPRFTGTATMLPAEFNAAVRKFGDDIRAYGAAALKFSHQQTDCVGTQPTDAVLHGTGFTASICEENP